MLARSAACMLLFVACAAPAAPPAPSELGALKEEVQRLRAEIEAMRTELHAISRRLGTGEPQAHRANVAVAGGEVLGDAHAPLTLVEFSDYQCPFCRRFHDQTFARLKAQYIDTGKVRYVFRDFPLDSLHPQARAAAEAAHCAGAQGKYWQAHDVWFQNQQHLRPADLKSYARKVGLDVRAFDECFDKKTYAQRVQDNLRDGIKAGVRGTPSFFLGKTGDGASVNGLLITGARPFEDFQQEIDQLLSEKNEKK